MRTRFNNSYLFTRLFLTIFMNTMVSSYTHYALDKKVKVSRCLFRCFQLLLESCSQSSMKEDILPMEIFQAISRTIGPIISFSNSFLPYVLNLEQDSSFIFLESIQNESLR